MEARKPLATFWITVELEVITLRLEWIRPRDTESRPDVGEYVVWHFLESVKLKAGLLACSENDWM